MTRWVLIDFSFLAYRAQFALKGLDYDDYPTGIVFGFFNQLRAICNSPRINSKRVLLFFDSKKSHRRQAYPEYKNARRKKRTEVDEEEAEAISAMWDQVRVLRDRVLPAMGVPTYRQTGLEADDLMAWAANSIQSRSKEDRAIIVTADQDLYQCIRKQVHWYDPARKLYLDVPAFRRKYGCHPKFWGKVKALAGCSSDNVAGIQGIGEKTAVEYLMGRMKPGKRLDSILSPTGQATIKRNKGLVILPHKLTKPIKVREPQYNPDAFFEACERYGLVMFLKQRNTWMQFFKGRNYNVRKRRGKK